VASVYLHKTESMRLGKRPDPWDPDVSGDLLVQLHRSFQAMSAEFDARPASEPAPHWYEPDQTVGCLVRRMAHETVVHRVDAELAAGWDIAAVPEDLAIDGVDEVLVVMLGFWSQTEPEEFADLPGDGDGDGPPVRVSSGGASWLLTPTARGVTIAPGGAGEAVATVAGDPHAMLLWLWGRADDTAVTTTGDPAAVTRLRDLLRVATE
jgi:hypothetical protein